MGHVSLKLRVRGPKWLRIYAEWCRIYFRHLYIFGTFSQLCTALVAFYFAEAKGNEGERVRKLIYEKPQNFVGYHKSKTEILNIISKSTPMINGYIL